MKPKKHLGQNFLTSIPARMEIVKAGEVLPSDSILEIGPGRGFLTRALLDTGARVVALEKDSELIPILTEQFASEIKSGQLTLTLGDALDFDPTPSTLHATRYKLIANIPYYITGAILERYLSHVNQPQTMVVLVQKEVAERVCARDGKESILSLSVKAYGEPKLIYRVSRGSFNPSPTVDSAVLQIKNISRQNFKNQYHEAVFFRAVKQGFAHKRKLLLSNLKESFPEQNLPELFQVLIIPPNTRAEDVHISTWLMLAEKLTENRK
jgi:16S rRNA (adenine1518-N6/adenine1519-N6)-dimethyltransferase